jgi:hypothetical protein
MASIVLFHNPKNLFSKLIELFQGSPISHSGIGMTVNGEEYVLHAGFTGVNLVPRAFLLRNHTIVAEFQVIPDIDKEMMQVADKHIGESYDVFGLLGYMFVMFGRWLKLKIHNPLASKSSVVCSELICEADPLQLIPEFAMLVPADTTPKDLFDICSNGKSFKRLI